MEHLGMSQSTLPLMWSNQCNQLESMDTSCCPRYFRISYHIPFVLLAFVIWTLWRWFLFFLHLKDLEYTIFILTTINIKKTIITILESGIQLDDLPRHSFLASHVSDTMCVDDGSSVPSYNFIKPANMWGSFKLTFEQWAMAAIADTSGCVIMNKS